MLYNVDLDLDMVFVKSQFMLQTKEFIRVSNFSLDTVNNSNHPTNSVHAYNNKVVPLTFLIYGNQFFYKRVTAGFASLFLGMFWES